MNSAKFYAVLSRGMAIIAIFFGSFSTALERETVKTVAAAKSEDVKIAPPVKQWKLPRHEEIKKKVKEKEEKEKDPKKSPKITKEKPPKEYYLPDGTLIITGTLTVEFDNPEQGDFKKDGKFKWPEPVITEEALGTEGDTRIVNIFNPGDYTEIISETVRLKIKEEAHKKEKDIENIWNDYTFGEEPRKYTIDEQLVISNPEPITPTVSLDPLNLLSSSTVQDIVKFGYTLPEGPRIYYHFYEKWESCFDTVIGRQCVVIAEASANINLDWRFHLWFPFQVTLNAPDSILPGVPVSMTSSITPYNEPNINNEDYEMDFLFTFVFNVYVRLAGATVVDVSLPNFHADRQENFAPPFEPNAGLSLAKKELTPITWSWPFSYISVIPSIDLSLNSSRVEAVWKVEAGGNTLAMGPVTYTSSGSLVPSSILIPESTLATRANIKLEFQKYYLDTLDSSLKGTFEFSVFGYGGDTEEVSLADWNIGTIPGAYFQSVPLADTVEVETFVGVDNVPPVIEFKEQQPGQWPTIAEIQDTGTGLATASVNCKFSSFKAEDWPKWTELEFNIPAFAPATTEEVLLRGFIKNVVSKDMECSVWAQDIVGNMIWEALPNWPVPVEVPSPIESSYRIYIPATLKSFDQKTSANVETAPLEDVAPVITFSGPQGSLWDWAEVHDAGSGLAEISVNCKFGSLVAVGDWPNWGEFDVNFPAFAPGTTKHIYIRGYTNNVASAEMECGLWAIDKDGNSTWLPNK